MKLRSGLVTGRTAVAESSPETKPTKQVSERRFPPCRRHPKGGGKCAACVMAGHTRQSYIDMCNRNPRLGYPRLSVGGMAPRKTAPRELPAVAR